MTYDQLIIGLILLLLLVLSWSIIWIAPLVAGLVALMSGLDLLPAYTETYKTGFVDFTKDWFPVFLFGASAVIGLTRKDYYPAVAVD